MENLKRDLRRFAEERDWGQFHSPKNLAAALTVEASELLEVFQWLTEDQSYKLSPKQMAQAREEVGDVFLYLLQLTDKLDIDMIAAARDKLATNAAKYPIDRAKGRSEKYTDL